MPKRICSIDGCDKTAVGRGWCSAHWSRWRNHGDPLAGPRLQVFKAIDHEDGTRTCSACGGIKPLDQFHVVKGATLGRRSDCKECRSLSMKAWYEANRDERQRIERDRKAANPDVYRERDRVRNRLEHRRELHAKRTTLRRSRLTEAGYDATVTRANLRLQYGDGCFYCGCPMDFTRRSRQSAYTKSLATIEHVVPVSDGGSHTWDNVVLACWSCNSSKKHSPLDAWLASREATEPTP